MKKTKQLFFIALSVGLLVGCGSDETKEGSTHGKKKEDVLPVERLDFPDFGYMISPTKYQGRVFRLSDKYPHSKPKKDKGVKKILSIDFKKDWRKYLDAVQDYVYEGNASTDYENSFFLEDNKVRGWYHVPWQHWGENGREGYHGLTHEGPVLEKMLAPTQTNTTYAYAVGFYNDLGGYTIGQVWKEDVPDYSILNKVGFPEGTVVAKLLFVDLNEEQVPYLDNPLEWNAYIYTRDTQGSNLSKSDTARTTTKMRLIQMDVMVKDSRANETGGWVFGNFAYNGELNKPNKWDNMIPVGIMWGNDPEVKLSSNNPQPEKTEINKKLKQTRINPNTNELPAMHLGWGSRLNGPVDNPNSSCMSCHSTAQYPMVSGLMMSFDPDAVPPVGTMAGPEWMRWFRNVDCGTPFDPGKAVSFDYSLQLSQSIQNYIEYATETQKGMFYEEFWSNGNKARNQ